MILHIFAFYAREVLLRDPEFSQAQIYIVRRQFQIYKFILLGTKSLIVSYQNYYPLLWQKKLCKKRPVL